MERAALSSPPRQQQQQPQQRSGGGRALRGATEEEEIVIAAAAGGGGHPSTSVIQGRTLRKQRNKQQQAQQQQQQQQPSSPPQAQQERGRDGAGCGLGPPAEGGAREVKRRGSTPSGGASAASRRERPSGQAVAAAADEAADRSADRRQQQPQKMRNEDDGRSQADGTAKRREAGGGKAGKNPAAAEYECSICFELLLDPVVGNCGHDFCKHCYEQLTRTNSGMNSAGPLCPLCRNQLPTDLGICVRLKDTIENLFPQSIRERRRQVQEEHAKKARTEPTSNSFPNILLDDGSLGVETAEASGVRLPTDLLRRFQYLIEEITGTFGGSTVTSGMPRIVPLQLGRSPAAMAQPSVQNISDTGASFGLAGHSELQGIGIPTLPTAAAAVLSLPAAITTPQWPNAPAAVSLPITLRPVVPSTVQRLVTPALVLSPTTSVSPAPAQLTPFQWGGPVGDVVFTMGWYDRDQGQTRRRISRRRSTIRQQLQQLR